MNIINPVLLTGGSGTRLWPISRKSYPKQFSRFFDDESLFQQAVKRLSQTNEIGFESPVILTNVDYRFIVGEQLDEMGTKPKSIIIEPEPKNTAPAILAACIMLFKIYIDI